MVKLSESVEREREAFLACFRGEKAGLVYAPTPGGEGRFVSDDEAVGFIVEFAEMARRHERWLGYSVWAAIPLMLFFFTLAGLFYNRVFIAVGFFALLDWLFVAIVQRAIRARFKWRIWARLDRHVPVSALSRQEKIRRGHALTVGQWIGVALAVALGAALQAPSTLIPAEWRDVRNIVIAFLCVAALCGLIVFGAINLFRWLRQRA